MNKVVLLAPITVVSGSSLCDIAPTSQFANVDYDQAEIRHQLLLTNKTDQEISVPIAFIETDPDESRPPSLRVGTERRDLGDPKMFDPASTEKFVNEAIAAAVANGVTEAEVRDSLREVLSRASRSRKTFVTIRPGERLFIEFTEHEKVPRDANGAFTYQTIAPFPQLSLDPAGGSFWLSVILPRPMGGKSAVLGEFTREYGATQVMLHDRQAVAWTWKLDPILRITYTYSG